jgi:glycosyltransferase involved in cell wall biosynthesis
MNVIVINDFAYVDGGASKIALGSAKALAHFGHRVTLFTAVGPVDPGLLDVENLSVTCLQQREVADDPNRMRAVIQGFWNVTAQDQMRMLLATLSPSNTIVHVHTWTKALSASVVQAALSRGFRVVLTLHDYFTVCPTGGFFDHSKQAICHLQPMSATCIATNCDSRSYGHKLWRVGRQWIQSHAGNLPVGEMDFISISNFSEKILAPMLPAEAKVHRVRNFIDMDQKPVANVEGNHLFSFSGRLSPEKGPQLLAECSRSLELDVLFIGDGILREQLAKIAPRASFTGWVSSEAACEAMRRSRALVIPSLWYETQGLVVAEAVAMGIPVIVPTTCAARDWVEDGVTGLLFRGGDVFDLAQKIVFLRDHPEAAATMGKQAYQEYWQHPARLSDHCAELEKVYGEILGISQP